MAIDNELLDQLLAGRNPHELFSKDGLLEELKKALSERILNTELDEHLEEERSEGNANRRNGTSKKTVLTGTSKLTLYARGMSVREIRGHLEELYGIDVSPDLISAITDAVMDEVGEWQNRPTKFLTVPRKAVCRLDGANAVDCR